VPHGVGDRLDRDPVGRRLDGGGQGRERDGGQDDPGQRLDLPAQRLDQAQLVERGWAQAVDDPPDVRDGLGGRGPQGGEHPGRAVRVVRDEVARGVRLEGDAGEGGAEAVVQVVAQPPALLLARRHDLGPGALELLGERGGVHGDRERGGQHLQRSAVPPAERPLTPPDTDDEFADPLPAVHQRHRFGGRRCSVAGDLGLPADQRRGGQPQRLAHRGQQGGRVRPAEPVTDPGQGAGGIGALAVEQPVRQPLQPHPHGIEGDRDHQRDQHRSAQPDTPDDAARRRDQTRVHAEHRRGEQDVDQGAGQDEPDVQQPVAQHRDGDRRRDERDGQQLQDRAQPEQPPRHQHRDDAEQREHQPQQLPSGALVAAPVAHDQRRDRRDEHDEVEHLRDRPQRSERRASGQDEPGVDGQRSRLGARRDREEHPVHRGQDDRGGAPPACPQARREDDEGQREEGRDGQRPGERHRRRHRAQHALRPPGLRAEHAQRDPHPGRRLADRGGQQQPADRVVRPLPGDEHAGEAAGQADGQVGDHERVDQVGDGEPGRGGERDGGDHLGDDQAEQRERDAGHGPKCGRRGCVLSRVRSRFAPGDLPGHPGAATLPGGRPRTTGSAA